MCSKVFINCPYDKDYRDFFKLLVFLCEYFRCEPCFASQTNSSEPRFEKIVKLIDESSVGIHDISRISLTNGLPRFNMPFELGMDMMHSLKCSKDKRILVLDGNENDYRRTLSDLNCSDIEAHGNNETKLVTIIRKFFINLLSLSDVPGPKKILLAYKAQFKTWLHDNLDTNGIGENEIDMDEFKIKVTRFFSDSTIICRPSA